MKNKNKNIESNRQTTIIEDILFYVIMILLIIISITIIWQRIVFKDKIPDIFGYKMFIVLDDKMDNYVEYGDLVFTYNIEPKKLKNGDLIAFRNNTNKVTLHKIINIKNISDSIEFEMQNSLNEVGDTKYVMDYQVEGIVINRLPNIGLVILKMQKPYIILSLIGIIILVESGCYLIGKIKNNRTIPKK